MDFSKELEQRVKEAIEAVPEAVASTAKRYFLERFPNAGHFTAYQFPAFFSVGCHQYLIEWLEDVGKHFATSSYPHSRQADICRS